MCIGGCGITCLWDTEMVQAFLGWLRLLLFELLFAQILDSNVEQPVQVNNTALYMRGSRILPAIIYTLQKRYSLNTGITSISALLLDCFNNLRQQHMLFSGEILLVDWRCISMQIA
jgi:hypothetical protein